MKYIAVLGTSGAQHIDWDDAQSDLGLFFLKHGCEPLELDPLLRYTWSTDLDGIGKQNLTWDAAGRALAHYIVPPLAKESLLKPEDTFLISHSHGGNVVAYACGKYGLKVNGLVTVGTPIREDLSNVYQAASANITRHLHLYASWRDLWQIFGSVFDGRFGIHREHPYADWNQQVPGGNHGSILRDRDFFPLWLEHGWLEYWRG